MPVTVAVATVLSLVVGACGSDDNTASTAKDAKIDCATGSIAGAGSTFVQNIAQQWVKDYTASCPGATINYQGVGSGAGIQQFTAGTVDFAGSDVALTATERSAAEAKYGNVLQIPWSAGAVAIEYRLDGVTELQLSPAALAGIFAGTITKWDDAAIKADNASTTLPATPIQVIHRSDGSGTTAAFTAYLSSAEPTVWTAGTGKDVKWPTGQGAKGSDGVTKAVKATNGAIAYAELSFAKGNSLSAVKIKNPAGKFVGPDEATGVTEALNEAEVAANLEAKINYAPKGANAYPISTVTYVITAGVPSDPTKANLIKSFVTYALGDGQSAATRLFYAGLSDAVLAPAKAATAGIGTPAGE